jgi:isoleucyl-tRNA synthetase
VKEVQFAADANGFFQQAVTVDWRAANSHFRRDAGRFRQSFEALSESSRETLAPQVAAGGDVQVDGFDLPVPANLFRMERAPDPRYGVAEEGDALVALDLNLSRELTLEGLSRDLVRHLQVMRKDVGLSVSQRIELGLVTESADLQQAICQHRDYIMDEVLAVKLETTALVDAKAAQDLTVEHHLVQVTMNW